MKVVICGPNLRDQSKGNFHVHKKGCADLKKRNRDPEYDNGWSIDADSRQSVVEEIYSDHMAEWERDHPGDDVDWREYDDIHVFPCCNGLPDLRSDDDDENTDEEDEEDTPVPFGGHDRIITLAQEHGLADGVKTAEFALTGEAILGYLEENLPEAIYETASSDDLNKMANAYATFLIKGFAEKSREVLNEFLEDQPFDEE